MSYMDIKNILGEGLFDFLKSLPNDVKKLKLTSAEKRLYKKDPKFRKLIHNVIKNSNEIDRLIKKSS
jgi:hypothetical protein